MTQNLGFTDLDVARLGLVQVGFCREPVQSLDGSGAHGFEQLYLALADLHLVLLWPMA